jgi:hypothetical protein
MAKYKRISGGEKTAKSGTTWTEDELRLALNLFLELEGSQIHEHNPAIQDLAHSLERSVRSLEAQMLMFRNLELGGDYSHGNMNQICRNLWVEHISNGTTFPKTDEGITASTESQNYPNDLLKWAGHRSGGVKKPFRAGTGRPAGKRFETALAVRLRKWATLIAEGVEAPSHILLVGGPGNGKTDTVEGLIEDLDRILNLDGRLFTAFSSKFSEFQNGEAPPRRVSVNLKSILPEAPEHIHRTITLIQDASETDAINFPEKTAQELLLAELDQIDSSNRNEIYICCVNRGILAQTYSEAQLRAQGPRTVELLTEVTRAVTSSPEASSCWPIPSFPSVVAWPMDIDTLVESINAEAQPSVLHQILGRIISDPSWEDECHAGKYCPFCENRRALAEPNAVNHLSELLRAFELGTGKRWTFRDLYSLISYILVGTEQDLVINGTQLSPCEWASKQVELLNSTKKSDAIARARALHRLSGNLYWHRLFPTWPRLAYKDFNDSRKKIIRELNEDLKPVDDLFRYLQWRDRANKSEAISKTVANKFCPLLDPANADPEQEISFATSGNNFTVRDIDERFCLSVGQGLKQVTHRISFLDREVLKRLATADDELNGDAISNQDSGKAEKLQTVIRMFACRLVKRALGTRNGTYTNKDNLNHYKQALENSKELKSVQAKLRSLINNDKRNLFTVPLMTTFAQPTPPIRRNLVLECQKVKVQAWKTEKAERPKPQMAYLSVDGAPVPLTFELFDALQRLTKGMHTGSLNGEVFAMIDRIRSRVAGRIVRDREALDDDAIVVVEATGEVIRFIDQEFSVELRENEA